VLDLTYAGTRPGFRADGAMRSAEPPAPDGPANLRARASGGGQPGHRDLGVLGVFSGRVSSRWSLHKVANQDLSAFAGQMLGTTAGGVTLTHAKTRQYGGDLSVADAPRVDIVAAYLGVTRMIWTPVWPTESEPW